MARDQPLPVKEQSDEQLMVAFCADHHEALDELFNRYASRVEALIRRLTGDGALAHDITQTTFLSVVRGRARFPVAGQFRPWLFTIAMNAFRDHTRRRKREVLVPDGGALLEAEPHRDRHRDAGLQRVLAAAMQQLPMDQRQAVTLHQLEGFSFAEIADIVGCSRAAAKVRAHRGYRRLRALVGDTLSENI